MAGEAKNLLTRTLATAADNSMQLYVVYNGLDYRIQLSTLLSLVTKAKLGLDNVDNTSDANKPISTATEAALAGKVSKEEWNLFVQQLSKYITIDDLNLVVDGVQTALQSKVSASQMQTAIGEALLPLSVALANLTTRVDALAGQSVDFVTVQALNTAISAVSNTITDLNAALETYKLSNDARVAALETRVTAVEERDQFVFGPNFW